MAKKFSTNIQPVYADLMRTEAQEVQEPQEVQDTQESYNVRNTQGKKGMKMDRMNMAFSQENFEYMRTMAGLHKMTMTKFVNHVLEEDRKRNADLYEKAKALMENL